MNKTEIINQQLDERAKEKAQEYLSKFSKEKAIDCAETMRDVAAEYEGLDDIVLWNKVINILKQAV